MHKILIKESKKIISLLIVVLNIFSISQVYAATSLLPFIANTSIVERKNITGGAYHSLAVKPDGTVWSWGYNNRGQLGDGTQGSKSTAVKVSNLTDVKSVSGGGVFSLALKSDGTIWGWGWNYFGQLGNGTNIDSSIPVRVSQITNNVVSIATGAGHSIALKSDGTVWAWGSNDYGELGDGTITSQPPYGKYFPIQVKSADGQGFLTDIIAITAGNDHSMALRSDGTVWAWGQNSSGQLGDGTNIIKLLPVKVLNLAEIKSISGGSFHSMALRSDGTVWEWGYNEFGLGIEGTRQSLIPIQVPSLVDIISISTNRGHHSLALKSDNTVWGWGWNYNGQLGDGTNINRSTPVRIPDLTGVIDIATGANHSFALKSDGTVWSWGYNIFGQLGDNTRINRFIPIQVLEKIIDSIPPDTSIISVIDNNGNSIVNNSSIFSDSITFTFSGTDNVDIAGFQCNLDNSVFADCTSQKTYPNFSIGDHVFKVRAKDTAGNVDDTPATFSWTIKPIPVILLPGILGSWTDDFFEPFTNPNPINQNKLSLIEESQAWFWKQLDDLGYLPHTWQDLKTELPKLGYPVYKCPFDWRNDNEYSAQNYLMPCIDKAKQETGSNKVNVVAHSMGGLTTRAYIQNDSLYRKDINKFAMVGTPNHGSPNIYYSWEGGSLSSIVSTNISSWSGILGAIFENTVGDRLTQMATHFLRTGKTSYIHSFFPSLQELLPTFDYLENQFGSVRNVLSMVWQNNFLNDLNSRSNIFKLNSQVNTKIFAGEGHPTLETIKILYPNPDNLFSNPNDPYPDGLPIPLLEEKNNLGDGTVLSQKSAKITETLVPFEVKTKTSDNPENFLQHTNLPNSFLNEIVSFLGGQLTTSISYSPKLPKEILAISLASPAELLIVDMQGRKLGFDYQSQLEKYEIPKGIYSGKDELELAMIIDPQPGEYKVFIIGNGDGEFNTGISYAKEGCDRSISQDNFGQTISGNITIFTINLQGGCQEDSVKYSLDSTIDIDPDVLNIDSKGNYITAYIELPNLYKAEDIDVSTIKLNNQISAIWFLKTMGDYDDDGIADLMVKFKRNEVQGIVSAGENQLTISGNLRDGTRFEGEDVVKVINSK